MAQHQTPDFGRIDELHTLLANRHRRVTLRYFRDASSDVASLHDIADVVEYDARSNTVRCRGHPDLNALIENLAYM